MIQVVSGHNYAEMHGSSIACASLIAILRQTGPGMLVCGVAS